MKVIGTECERCGTREKYGHNHCAECAKQRQKVPHIKERRRLQKRDADDKLFYNLLPGEREQLREFQRGIDPITGQPLQPNANCDHDHRTGLIRGLLNPMTNKFLVDDLKKLDAMRAYIANPPAPKALGETVYGLIGRAQRKRRMKYGPNGDPKPHVRLHEK